MGKIIAIIGPSTAGKNFLADFFIQKFGFRYIPSVTTRPPRKGEKSIYKHHTKGEFEEFIAEGKLLEYTVFDGHYYGKLAEDVRKYSRDNHCLYTMTADRVLELKSKYPNVLVVCLHVPSPTEKTIAERLKQRGHDTGFIKQRLKTVKNDLEHINFLNDEGHIDFHIQTIEGDKEYTLKEGNKIIDLL